MQLGRIFDVLAAIVAVAMAFVLVASPNTSGIIRAAGDTFSGGLRAAEGR